MHSVKEKARNLETVFNEDSSPSLGFMAVEPAASQKAAALANWREKKARVSVLTSY